MDFLQKKGGNKSGIERLVLFFLSPILSLIPSVLHPKNKYSLFIFFLFGLLFGWLFTTEVGASNDGSRHMERFLQWANTDVSDLKEFLVLFFSGDGAKDIYTFVISFFVSRFTDDYHFFFLAVAFVFSLFTVLFIKEILKYWNELTNDRLFYAFLVLILLFSDPIYNINSLRFPTAASMVIYGYVKYSTTGRFPYLLFIAASPMIHSAFLIFVFFVIVSLFYNKESRLLYVVFVVSIFMSLLTQGPFFELLRDISIVPDFLKEEYLGYASQEGVEEYRNVGLIQTIFRFYLSTLFVNICMLILYASRRNFKNPYSKHLTNKILLLLTCINMVTWIPQMQRFYMIIIVLIVMVWGMENIRIKNYKFIYFYPFFNLFTLYVYLFQYIPDVVSYLDLFLPPIIHFI